MKICFNGDFFPADAPILTADNTSFKWGEGLFETMKVVDGKIILLEKHVERLFHGLSLLQINKTTSFTQVEIEKKSIALCQANHCSGLARIRLAAYANANNEAGYVIEAIPLPEAINQWQQAGLNTATFPHAKKSIDVFATLKSANYLPYRLAAKYAQANGLDDCLLINTNHHYCDSSKANIFLVKANIIFTPSLTEGCINGVMRNQIIATATSIGYTVKETSIRHEDLLTADEIFLSNAIQIIRWVKSFDASRYHFNHSLIIFEAVKATIFSKPC